MNVRVASRSVLAVAVVLGLLAAVLVARYMNTAVHQTSSVPMGTEVVAAEDIPAGTLVGPAMLRVARVPVQYVQPGSIPSVGGVVGQIARVEIFPGQIVVGAQVASSADGSGLAFLVPEGRVALSIAVDQLAGFDGMLKPGDRVDVLAVLPAGGGVPTQRVTTALRGVRLLAVGAATDPTSPPSGYTSVTLAVTAQEAEELVYLERFESLTLTLQPAAHPSLARVAGFDQNGLAGVVQ